MLTFALLLIAADPAVGTFQTYGDWAVACDNLQVCEMTSLVGEDGDWPEDGPRAASIRRDPGPSGGFEVEVDVGKANGSLTLAIDGQGVARAVPGDGTARFRDAEAARIVDAMIAGETLTMGDAKISLKGSSAALRFIDAGQGRAGTVTAAVAKGARPATAVPAAPAVPRIPAVRPGGTPAPLGTALRRRLEKSAGCGDMLTDTAREGEVETVALGGGASLALVPCESGAYNINTVPFILRGGKAEAADLDHAQDGNGEAATLTNGWWDAKTGVLATHAKSRGIGDCGESASYVWDGQRFRLIELRRMDECRGSINWLRTWKAEPVYR